jgi:hypothetical protein
MTKFNKYREIEYKGQLVDFYVNELREYDDVTMLLEDLVEVLGYVNENDIIEKLLNEKYLLDYVYQGELNGKTKLFIGRYAIDNLAFNDSLNPGFEDLGDLAINVYRSLKIYDLLKNEYDQIIENLSDSPVYKKHLYTNENRDGKYERLLYTD